MKRTEPKRWLKDGAPYTPSHATNIRDLFARVRAEMLRTSATVTTLPQRRQGSIK